MSSGVLLLAGVRFRAIMSRLPAWFSCTVSRAAILTGRYAIRTGATQGTGITLWEVTIAEALQSIPVLSRYDLQPRVKSIFPLDGSTWNRRRR